MKRRCAVVTTSLLALAAAPVCGQQIRALSGDYNEPLVAITGEGAEAVVETAARSLKLDTVKSIRFQDTGSANPRQRGTKVLLTTRDWLRGELEDGTEEGVVLRSKALGKLKIPLDLVRAIIPETSPAQERRLEATLDAKQTDDKILLRDGSEPYGSILQIDGRRVVLDTEGGMDLGVLTIDLEKAQLIAVGLLDEPPPPQTELHVALRLVDGSQLVGDLDGLSNDVVRLRHPLSADGPLEIEVARVAEITIRNGKFVYLSDMIPAAVKQTFPPEFTYYPEKYGYKLDRNNLGGPLRLSGQVYERGLGVHSYCALTYALNGGFGTFKATIGLDDSTRHSGSALGGVIFRVLLDDGRPAPEVGEAGIHLKRGDSPKELTVDVTNVKRLTLVADLDPTSLHILGRANWADAHLIRD